MAIRKPAKRKLTRKRSPRKAKRELALWEKLVAIGKQIPPEERANFPRDGARNLDHYLYGSPKQD